MSLAIVDLVAVDSALRGTVAVPNGITYPYTINFLVNDTLDLNDAVFTSSSITLTEGYLPEALKFNIAGLSNGTTYAIMAFDGLGNSTSSEERTPSSVPLRPVLSISRIFETSVELKVDYGASQGSSCEVAPLFYKIKSSNAIQKNMSAVPAFNYAGKSAPFTQVFTVSGLTIGSVYEFSVCTKNAAGLSPLSNTVVATPSDVCDAPGVPTLELVNPNSSNMSALKSTITMPSQADASKFIDRGSSPYTSIPVAKFEIYTDLYKNGTLVDSLQHQLTAARGTDITINNVSTATYTGVFTAGTVTFQIASYAEAYASYTAKSRTVMTAGNNLNNIVDQESSTSSIVRVAGDVGIVNSVVLQALRGFVSVTKLGSGNTQVAVAPYLVDPAEAVSDMLSLENYAYMSHEIRIMAPADDLSYSGMTSVERQGVAIPEYTLGPPSTVPTSISQMSDSVRNFVVSTAADFDNTVKFQVRSMFVVGGYEVKTRWRDVPATSIANTRLATRIDSIALTARASGQVGSPAIELSWTPPTQTNLRGLTLGDYVLSARPTAIGGAVPAAWVAYDAVARTNTGLIYKSSLPAVGGAAAVAFVNGTSYDFKIAARGSKPSSSAIELGEESSVATIILAPNSFKSLSFTPVNDDEKTTLSFDINAWNPAEGEVAGYSNLINFVEDESSKYYINPVDRDLINITYLVTRDGVTTPVSVDTYVLSSLTNGRVYAAKVQARYSYTAFGDAQETVIYSEVYNLSLNPSGAPTLSDDSIAYDYLTSLGVAGRTITAPARDGNPAVTMANIPAGVIDLRSTVAVRIDARGSPLISYTAILIPKTYSSTLTQSDLIRQESLVGFNTNNALTFTTPFVVKAVIVFVQNGVGTATKVIPAATALAA